MEMLATLASNMHELSPWLMFSRVLVGSAWSLALWQIWKARHAPLANQAFVAALALVLGEVLLIFHKHLPIETLTFFLASAQVVMAIAIVKIFRWAQHLTHTERLRVAKMEEYRMRRDGVLKTYCSSILVVTFSGLMYFALTWIEQGF